MNKGKLEAICIRWRILKSDDSEPFIVIFLMPMRHSDSHMLARWVRHATAKDAGHTSSIAVTLPKVSQKLRRTIDLYPFLSLTDFEIWP